MTDPQPSQDRARSPECLPEWVLSVYVDRELEPAEARGVENHCAHCAACRGRVAALEAESHVLRAALAGEAPAPAPAAMPVGARSLTVSAVTAVALAFAALTVLGWLLDAPLPAALAPLDPRGPSGPFALLFDLLATLGNRPDLARLAVPVSGLWIAAMLLSAALPRRVERSRTAVLLVIGCATGSLVGAPAPAAAFEMRHGEQTVVLPAGEVVEQTWLARAETVAIDGTLRGDLIAVAERVIVSGVIEGNLVSGARRIEISGQVTGSVIAAGERIRISGTVARNLYTAADQTTLADSGRIGGDLLGFGEGIEISGEVGRDVMGFAGWLDVRGTVERDVTLHVGRAEVLGDARVGGDLHATYESTEGGVNIDPRAAIGGETEIEARDDPGSGDWDRYTTPAFYASRALSFAAAMVFGVLLFSVVPWLFAAELRTGSDLFRFLGLGLAALVLFPVTLVLLALTVIGIPAAILGLMSLAAGIYSANLVVGVIVGVAILGRDATSGWRGFARRLALGLAVVFVTIALPYLGGVLRFLALLLGLGAIAERVWVRARI